MSSSAQYHRTRNDMSEDSDSDLDLDLQELDPSTSTAGNNLSHSSQPRRSKEERRADQERSGLIALRSLRMGGLRGINKRSQGYGELGRGRDEEDLGGLLHDDDARTPRESMESLGEDVAESPLMGSRNNSRAGRRIRRDDERGSLSRLGSRLRIPGFGGSNIQLAEDGTQDDEPEDSHSPTATRTVLVGQTQTSKFPPNAISNAKYSPASFIPVTLYNEFKFFFNLYFLLVAMSQLIPYLQIGYLSTYIAPLAFVLSITLGKEALDDIARRRRDSEANSEPYIVLRFKENTTGVGRTKPKKNMRGHRRELSIIEEEEEEAEAAKERSKPTSTVIEVVKRSRDLKVGDVLKMGKDQRVPADVVILKSVANESPTTPGQLPDIPEEVEPGEGNNLLEPFSNPPIDTSSATIMNGKESTSADGETQSADAGGAGETFLRTDQLDGETDWKLRLASSLSQELGSGEYTRLRVRAGSPDKKVHEFTGTLELLPKGAATYAVNAEDHPDTKSVPLNIDNTAWANTVLASNATTLAVVVYTGSQTRQALSTSVSRSKTGLLEDEINSLTKILCAVTLFLSVMLVALDGFRSDDRAWYLNVMRFLILFSTIVPISLRVNLDMGKSVYAWFIQRDTDIQGAVVRTSTIPEELGRIEYLLSDKTGTLTQNEMELKKIHVGTVSYANEAMDEVHSYIKQGFSAPGASDSNQSSSLYTPSSTYAAPTAGSTATRTRREIGSRVRDIVLALALCHNVTPTTEEVNGENVTSYQASSPDEIAIVKWTESVGLRVLHRDRKTITLQSCDTGRVVVRIRILEIFPFTSEGKRMGAIVQFFEGEETGAKPSREGGDVWFYQKGADTVMTSIVAANDWLDEETANMAREGLRTLVVGRKKLSAQQYQEFSNNYRNASLALQGRDSGMAKVVASYLERDLELLGVTGVEDKLQRDVKPSLELLRNAGIKIWMLTGDKVETARCVAVSSKLVARGQYIHTIQKVKRKDHAQDTLDFLRNKPDACLLIDGESLQLYLTYFRQDFISLAVKLPTVVACRCSPTQKADVAKLIRAFTKKRVCCIGDGGNDVSMIQAADVGVGIVGKEGRQASLAADFSIERFCDLTKLLVWHGRNSYKRSAKLAQFVIHRGLLISICQTVYSIAHTFSPDALYRVSLHTKRFQYDS
jgi:phospholipid-translocating ATPase